MHRRFFYYVALVIFCLMSHAFAQTPTASLNVLRTLQGHSELVYSVGFAPNGKQLVSGSFDKSVRLWDVATGKETKSFAGAKGHQDIILSTAFHPAGNLVASCGKDNTIKLWEMPGNSLVREYAGSPTPPAFIGATQDGSRLVGIAADHSLRIWNGADGKLMVTIPSAGKPIQGLAISANNQQLACALADGTIQLWSMNDGGTLGTFAAHSGGVTALAFHPSNQTLFSVGMDGCCKSWTLPVNEKKSAELPGKAKVLLAQLNPTQSHFLLVCSDRTLRTVKADTGALEKSLAPAPADITCASWMGNVIAAGLADGRVALWDAGSGALLNTTEFYRGRAIGSVSLRNDGQEIAAACEDGTIRMMESTRDPARPVEELYAKRLPLQPVGSSLVAYHPTQPNLLATISPDRVLKLWQIKEGKILRSIPLEGPAQRLAWNQDGSQLGVAVGNSLLVLQAADGKVIAKLPHAASIESVHFTTPGNLLTVSESSARLWDIAANKEMVKITTVSPKSAQFSKDGTPAVIITSGTIDTQMSRPGKTLAKFAPLKAITLLENGAKAAIAGDDGLARIINLANGAVEKEFKGHAGAVIAITVSADQKLVATAGVDKVLRIFSIPEGKEIKALPLAHPTGCLVSSASGLVINLSPNAFSLLNAGYTPGQPVPAEFGKEIFKLDHPHPVKCIAIGGNTIFSSGADNIIRAWKFPVDGPLRSLAGHTGLVDAVAFSPDGQTLASCSHDGTLRLWNPQDGKQLVEIKLTPQPQPFYCLAWRPDGKQIAVGGFDHGIRIVDVLNKKIEREIKGFDDKSSPKGHHDAIYGIQYAANGRQLYSAGADGLIKNWNCADGGFIKTFIDPALKEKAHRDWINQIKLTPDESKLIAVGNGGWLTVWSTADGKLLGSQKLPTGLYGTAVSPDGKLMATGNQNGSVFILQMP